MRDAEFEQRLLRVARGLEKALPASGKRPMLPYAAA